MKKFLFLILGLLVSVICFAQDSKGVDVFYIKEIIVNGDNLSVADKNLVQGFFEKELRRDNRISIKLDKNESDLNKNTTALIIKVNYSLETKMVSATSYSCAVNMSVNAINALNAQILSSRIQAYLAKGSNKSDTIKYALQGASYLITKVIINDLFKVQVMK